MLIDWFTVIAQAANFLILVWLMKRYLYHPILAAIDSREARIAAQLKDAETKQAAAARERADFQQKNAVFEQNRDALLKTAQLDAKTAGEALLEQARKNADALRAKLDAAVQSERASLGREVAVKVKQEVFAIARKTLADLANVSVEAQISAIFADRLRRLDDKAKAELGMALKAGLGSVLVRSAFELPAPQREAIQQALKETFDTDIALQFETKPSLVCGIELSANGQKLAWSIDDYLTELGREIDSLLAPASQVDVKPNAVIASQAA
jgi:F-type H+-transporting ATPase subunit b